MCAHSGLPRVPTDGASGPPLVWRTDTGTYVNADTSEGRPSPQHCVPLVFASLALKCWCRWEAEVSPIPGPELNQREAKSPLAPSSPRRAPEKG